MKTCTKCKIEKPLEEFSKHRKNKDGLQYKCKTCTTIYNQEYYQENKEKRHAQIWVYYQENKEERRAKQNAYDKGHKEERNAYRLTHKEEKATYQKDRKKKDPAYKLMCLMRTRFWSEMKGKAKTNSVTQYLGCTKEEAWKYIESQMPEGMTRNDWGVNGIHIDHIIPLSSFDMSLESERYKAWHYTNLQPLLAKDNLSKGKKVPNAR